MAVEIRELPERRTSAQIAHRKRWAFAEVISSALALQRRESRACPKVCGKPTNRVEKRRDLRLVANQTGKRQCVVAMRDRNGRALPFVSKPEAESVPAIQQHVKPEATVYADDSSAWDMLRAGYLTKRINHSVCYSDGEACTNLTESYFSRLRRAEIGTHHHIAGPYVGQYADEMAWCEDHRRERQRAAISPAGQRHPGTIRLSVRWGTVRA